VTGAILLQKNLYGEIAMINKARIEERQQRLTTPRAAAVAGIFAGLLFIALHVLVRLAITNSPEDPSGWQVRETEMLTLGLRLVPFAGIAFLWFIGVARDRLGQQEDRFFATVFLGSGLLYLAMTFTATAIAGGLLSSATLLQTALDPSITKFGLLTITQITNVYGVRMAAVFMLSMATIWLRTEVMPRWLAVVTYVLGLGLLLLVNLSLWATLIFPAWIFGVSVLILISNYRRTSGKEIKHPNVAENPALN
jgi:hypothetical protein